MTVTFCILYLIEKRYVWALSLLLVLATIQLTASSAFPTSFPPDIESLIAYSVPGKSNSLWHQSDSVLTVSPELIYLKLKTALTMQYSDWTVPLFSILTYLAIPSFILLFYHRKCGTKQLLWLSFISFGLYVGIVLFLQFQVRYQQIIAPAAVALVSLALCYIKKNHTIYFTLILSVAFVAVDWKLVAKARAEGSQFDRSSQQFMEFIGSFPADHRIVFIDKKNLGSYLHLVRSSKPRQVMVVGTDWLSSEGYASAIELFKPNLIIYTETTRALAGNGSLTEIAEFQKVGKLYYEASPSTD